MLATFLLAAAASQASVKPGAGAKFSVSGYRQSCGGDAAVYLWEKGAWRQANRQLPGKGLYYLDGKLVGYGACDYVTCNEFEGPVVVSPFEYRQTGAKPPPKDIGTSVPELPVFETVELRGKLKVELSYFTDPKCTQRKTATKVLRR